MLPGYQLRFNKKSDVDASGKCSINTADSVVYIAVFEISQSDREVLDRVEGLGKGYNQLVVHSEKFGDCTTYIANPSVIDETIQPMDWYKEMVLLGCRSNGFPIEYVRAVEAIAAVADHKRDRASANWNIVEELRNGG